MLKKQMGKGIFIFNDAFKVREKVFIQEQNINPSMENDEFDMTAIHIVVYDTDKINFPVATARLIEVQGKWKIGRVCVLKEYRKKNIASEILTDLINKAFEFTDKVFLSAHIDALNFYHKFGFVEFGKEFEIANAKLINMVKIK